MGEFQSLNTNLLPSRFSRDRAQNSKVFLCSADCVESSVIPEGDLSCLQRFLERRTQRSNPATVFNYSWTTSGLHQVRGSSLLFSRSSRINQYSRDILREPSLVIELKYLCKSCSSSSPIVFFAFSLVKHSYLAPKLSLPFAFPSPLLAQIDNAKRRPKKNLKIPLTRLNAK